MFCQNCGSKMERIPNSHLPVSSGMHYYGCKNCDRVIEYHFCSMSGREMGTKPSLLTYTEYLKRQKNK